jgi:hypothetical protein
MSHAPDLIARIRTLLESEYSPDSYSYIIEQCIAGTRMYPDIQIRDASGHLRCVVEVGYTRPEKLTTYRHSLKIPDVRWYDKQGQLHGDVTERTLQLKVQTAIRPSGVFAVYYVRDKVQCVEEDCYTEVCCPAWSGEPGKCRCDPEAEECDPTCEVCCEKKTEASFEEVDTIVVTDRVKAFFPSFCDKCGNAWLPGGEDEACFLMMDLQDHSPREFARYYGGAQRMTWDEALTLIADWGLALDYGHDGDFLREDDAMRLESAVTVECDRARAESSSRNGPGGEVVGK